MAGPEAGCLCSYLQGAASKPHPQCKLASHMLSSKPECCVKHGRIMLDYSSSSHCGCTVGHGTPLHNRGDGFGVGIQNKEKSWQQRCPCLCIKQLYLSHRENKALKNIIHYRTVHTDLSKLRHWKQLPNSHIGQPVPSFPHIPLTDRKGQGQQATFLWNRELVSKCD